MNVTGISDHRPLESLLTAVELSVELLLGRAKYSQR